MFERFDQHEERLASHADVRIVETQTHPTWKKFLHNRFCTAEQDLRMLLIDRLGDQLCEQGKKGEMVVHVRANVFLKASITATYQRTLSDIWSLFMAVECLLTLRSSVFVCLIVFLSVCLCLFACLFPLSSLKVYFRLFLFLFHSLCM